MGDGGSWDEGLVRLSPDVTAQTEVVLLGGAVTAVTLENSYRQGLFPMSIDVDMGPGAPPEAACGWFAPARRAVLRYPGMQVSRSLRRSLRGFEVTYDRDFGAVLAGCADPSRSGGWIAEDYEHAYLELAAAGRAHSVEVWQDGRIVGGLIGLELGGLFCADSKFRTVTDASKAAVAGLSQLVFSAPAAERRLIDAQWRTSHLASLGFAELERSRYEAELPGLLELPPAFPPAPGSRTR